MGSDAHFWLALLQIIGVNVILSGDNAVVIALACRGLPARQQKLGIAIGALVAVLLRVGLTIFIVYLLTIPYLNLVGGLLLLWIGYRLMLPEEGGGDIDLASSLWAAVRIVVIADAVMSLDNVIAVAAAAHGNLLLLVLGLVISVPLVVYGATLLIALIKRFPAIVPGGAALIGYVGAEIMLADPALAPWVASHAAWLEDGMPLVASVLVVLIGGCRAALAAQESGHITADAATAAAFPVGFFAAQALGRIIARRVPALLAFLASLFGFAADLRAAGQAAPLEILSLLHAARPFLAAVIAVFIGEFASFLVGRLHRAR
jgi:YjbE family integral membrane protein